MIEFRLSWFRIVIPLALLLSLPLGSPTIAQLPQTQAHRTQAHGTQAHGTQAHGEQDSFIEWSIPSKDGKVAWSDVADQMADQLRLDPESVRRMLPAGHLDLRSATVMLTLVAINLTAGDALYFGRGQDASGAEILKVRCRRSFFSGLTPGLTPGLTSRKPQNITEIDLDQNWRTSTSDTPLVLFLHGMNSGPEAFDPIREYFRSEGFATGALRYDYRQSIAESSHQLSIALTDKMADKMANQMKGQTEIPPLCLVGHSMGGLVARHYVESMERLAGGMDPKCVKQLITLGTPHQGSHWASLPPVSDLLTEEGLDSSDLMDVLLHRPSSQGIRDLIPGSPFLQALNSQQRQGDVQYTAIIGTVSPVSVSEAGGLRDTLQSLNQDGSFIRLIEPRIRPLIGSFDELTSGKGDGVVSVTSATLAGITDNVEIPVSHFEMIPKGKQKALSPVWSVIRNRIGAQVALPR